MTHEREMSRVLALDVGDRRIGVAISDPTRLLARGLKVIYRRKDGRDLATIAALLDEYEAGEIVIGYPRHLSGDVGEQARQVEEYAEALANYLAERRGPERPVRIIFWDERFSSVTAEEILHGTGRRPREQRRGDGSRRSIAMRRSVDAVAAAVILQDYLNAHLARRQASSAEAPPNAMSC